MRIGIDARFYGPVGKGLGRYTEKLVGYLERVADPDDEFFVFLRKENFDVYVPGNPRFRKVLADYPWYSISEQIFFPFLLRKYRLDVMHFPHFNVPILYERPFVVTIHDLILLRFPTVRNTTRSRLTYKMKYLAYRLVIATAIRRAKVILTVSRFTERDILTAFPTAVGKTVVTYEGCDFETESDVRGNSDISVGHGSNQQNTNKHCEPAAMSKFFKIGGKKGKLNPQVNNKQSKNENLRHYFSGIQVITQ